MVRISGEAKEIVRQRLLEEAAVHFARDGVDRANINSIAVAAGFAKGTIYNYFSSKEELFGEVLTAACRRTAARYAASPQGDSVRARLEALVAADVEVLRDEEPFMKVLIREAMSFRPATYPVIVESTNSLVSITFRQLSPQELDAYRAAYTEEVARADVAILTGSLPQGTPESIYRELAAVTKCPMVLDFRGEGLLSVLDLRPLVVKPLDKDTIRDKKIDPGRVVLFCKVPRDPLS